VGLLLWPSGGGAGFWGASRDKILFARGAEPFNRSFARADLRKMLAKLYAAEHTEASLAPMRKAA
jgi:hypothetical protein